MKRDPAIIRRRAFVRRAALVNFVLPVTIRLRNPCDAAQNPAATGTATCTWQGTALNEDTPATANVNLGPSLGQRTIALGGSLAGEVRFNDTFDGGALGNVAIKLLPSSSKFLKTSSVPLLWNSDIGDPGTRSDANYMRALARAGSALDPGSARQGCGDFTSGAPGSTAATPSGYNAFAYGLTPPGSTFGTGNGLPGYPYYDAGGPGGLTTPAGYLPIFPGAEGIDRVRAGSVVGDNDFVGPNPHPFPYAAPVRPGGAYGNASDTVLRTAALDLGIAPAGVQVDGASGTSTPSGATGLDNGPQGTQSIVTGQSGGEANLFGNIPGKGHSIDVTVNLATTINAIARITDQDVFNTPLKSGDPYPAHVFNCRQVWLGGVQNYIPGVRLKGNLRIAPAITKDGKLRIAKATVQSSQDTHLALSACLFPHSPYAKPNANTTLNTAPTIPLASATGTPGKLGTGLWPQNSDVLPESGAEEAYAPSTTYGAGAPTGAKCNTPAWKLVRDAGLTGSVDPLLPASAADGYTTTNSGAQVTVAGDINVPPLNVDVLIGDASDIPANPPPPIPPDTFITAAPAGTTNATSATITFMASQPSATFECRLDFGPWGVCSSPDALTGLSNGSHTFEVRAKSTGGTYDPSPAAATWTVNTSYTGPITFTGSPPPGNTVTNNPGGGSPSATVPTASVTTPVGGPVSITPTVAGPPPPVGYSFLGQNLTITASPATPGNPLAITLSLDVSGNPGITTANDVVIFRNGSPIPDCSPNNGQANPDPCVASRSLTGGIATITALTSAASVWNLGEQQPPGGPAGPIAEFGPSTSNFPVGIVTGGDGNLWYSEYAANRVARLTPAGAPAGAFAPLSGAPGPSTTTGPAGLTVGPDGNVWFLKNVASMLARVTPSGTVTEIQLPTNSGPAQLAVGPDGNFWITLYQGNAIARVTPSGTVTPFDLGPTVRNPRGITLGPDGNLWFTEQATGTIGRITPGGTITRVNTSASTSQPFWVTTGADGNLWFTEGTTDLIGRVTPAGVVTTFNGLTPGSTPRQIAPGPDGSLWFTEYGGHRVGRITLAGEVDEYPTPTTPSGPWSITGGPDGNVWFTEAQTGKIGRVPLAADTRAPQTWITGGPSGTTTATDASFTFSTSEPASATFECRLDGASFSTCTSPRSYTGLASGAHTFEVRARDAAGNVDPVSASRSWTINQPSVGVSGVVHTSDGRPVSALHVSLLTDAGVEFQVGTTNQFGYWSGSVPDGTYSISVQGNAWAFGTSTPDVPEVFNLRVVNVSVSGATDTGTLTLPPTVAANVRVVDGAGAAFTAADVKLVGSTASGATLSTGGSSGSIEFTTWNLAPVTGSGVAVIRAFANSNVSSGTPGSGGSYAVRNDTLAVTPFSGTIGAADTTITVSVGGGTPSPISEFPITAGSSPVGIMAGADGNLWFSEFNANKVGKIPPSGLNPIEYPVPTGSPGPQTTSGPAGKILGPDGNIWFLEFAASKIAKVASGGAITEYPLPAGSGPAQLVVGPDGNFWVSFLQSSAIAKVSPAGTLLDTYPIAGNPRGITVGPDGNLWFALENANRIGRISTGGQIDTFDIAATPNSQPFWITPGADGALWFTEGTGNKIGRITTGGQITDEFAVPTANSTPKQITTGSNGDLYFTEYTGHKIARITLGGTITEYATPTANSAPWSIIGGPDGNVWFTEIGGSSIGRVTLSADTTAPQTWITDGPSGTAGPNTSFSFLTTEPASATFECRLDGAAFATCPSPKTYSGLSEGSHTLEVRARDAAGNADATPASRTWTVAPVATASGVVYDDVNNNGAKDAGEPGVGGRTVYVDLNANRQRDAGSEPSATTQVSGAWTLSVPTSGAVSGEIRTVLRSGAHCSQPANPGPGDVNCGHSVTFQPNGTYAARDFGLFTIPSSMVALGDSVTRGFGSPPCGLAYCPQNSWSTGTTTAVNSHFQRIRAINPAMTVADNLAVGGAKMAGLRAQVDNAIAQPTDYEYVTIHIGAEDLCESDFADLPGQPDVMTSAVDFHDQFQSALSALMTGLPQARVFVGSLGNPQTGYDALASSPNYPTIFANWSARHGCRNVLGDLATTQTRADALARTVAYNQALHDVCAQYAPRCVDDGGWIFNEPASESEVSTADYTHPNVAGQAHYARSYAHGFNWTLAGTAAASGVVYDDINISGAQSPGEPGVNGRTVYVDLNGNQQLDAATEPSAVTQTIAGVQGAWQLTLNDVPVGGLGAQIRTALASGRRCAQPASPGPAHTDCSYTVNFQRDGVYADRDFGTYDLPASMAALGDSLTQAHHALAASTWPWPGFGVGSGLPTSYPIGCSAAVLSGLGTEPKLWDCPGESWATGTDPAVNSHAQRLRALTPGLTADNLAVSGATVADLQAQAQAARNLNGGQGVDYVTISIGPNDLCIASALPGDTITPVATFESRLRTAMQTLMNNNPHKPRVLLGSVINPASYYNALVGVGAPAIQRWLFYQFCANVTGYTTPYAQVGAVTTPHDDPTVVASRAAAGAMSVSYSNAVQTVCAEFAPYCRYDGGAANTYTAFQVADASTQDYWHPAVSGQAKFAQLWWNAGFNW